MIGVYGGTFDPIHLGHINFASNIQSVISLKKIHFIPCGIPAHREAAAANNEQRLMLLEAALGNEPQYVIDDREIRRGGVSYMIDTLQSLKQDYPDEGLSLLLGSDAFLEFEHWRDWQGILNIANLIIAERPGFDSSVFLKEKTLSDLLERSYTDNKEIFQNSRNGKIWIEKIPQFDISSSQIRDLVKRGEPFTDFLHPKVSKLITEQKLYR